MTANTARFGDIEYDNKDVICFSEGLVGFPNYQNFLILNHKEGSIFRWLQCLDEPSLAFLMIQPGELFTGYDPEISDAQASSIGLSEDSPTVVFAIVTIPRGNPNGMTANLAGPIVINAETQAARQMILDSDQYHTKHLVFAADPVEEPVQVAA